jgi:outer membrane biosynthesis protein TonB
MNLGRQLVVFALASVLFVSLGCEKKKPQLPAQAKAPADAIETPLPDQISETVPPPPPPQPKPQAPPPEVTVVKPPKHHNKKKIATTAPPASLQAANPPVADTSSNNTVAMAHPPGNPAAETSPDPAIAADVSNAQLAHQKQSTAQLLDDTEKTINGLKGLSHDQQEMVTQVRSIVNQSRKATSDGDFERAYNLATKAHLLSDALVKK